MYRQLLNNLLLVSCIFYTATSSALPDDFDQEVTIVSDSALLDRKTGQVTYSGDVVLTQGTLRIESDQLTVTRKDNVFEKAIAIGNPAQDRKSTRLNSSHVRISYAVFCL